MDKILFECLIHPDICMTIEKETCLEQKLYNKENFDDRFQFAYKPNHSCLHPIILTRHLIEMEILKKRYVMVLMID